MKGQPSLRRYHWKFSMPCIFLNVNCRNGYVIHGICLHMQEERGKRKEKSQEWKNKKFTFCAVLTHNLLMFPSGNKHKIFWNTSKSECFLKLTFSCTSQKTGTDSGVIYKGWKKRYVQQHIHAQKILQNVNMINFKSFKFYGLFGFLFFYVRSSCGNGEKYRWWQNIDSKVWK